MANPSFTQVAYRLRNDDGSESGATWKAAQNVSSIAIASDQIFRVRFLIDETANRSWTSYSWYPFYSLNGGGYQQVGAMSSDPIQVIGTTWFADGDDTTSQLTGGSGSFLTNNNACIEGNGALNSGAAGNFFEVECSLRINSSATNPYDTIQIRIYQGLGAIAAYTQTPLIYVDSAPNLAQPHFRIRSDDSQTLNADAGWKAAIDTNATMDAGKAFRIRFEVESNGGSFTDTFKLQFRKNSGTWADCVVTGGTSTPGVLIIQSDLFAENDATTNLLSGSSATFEAGEGKETLTTLSHTLNNEHTEFEWGIMLMGLYDARARNANGDTYEFRIVGVTNGVFGGTYTNPTITVNMPAGYIGGTSPETQGRTLHVDSNKNLYYITEPAESGGLFCIIKSSDGGDSWTVMDAAGSPTETDLESVDASYDSSLHCLHIIHKGSGTSDVVYHRYHTSDHPTTPDDFNIIDEVIAASIGQTDQSCAIQHRSDGTIVAFYRKTNGAAENMMYKIRSSGGTWGSELTIDAEASQVFGHICVVKGASDKIHIFYNNWTAGIGYHRSLSSGDSLSAREVFNSDLDTGSSSEKNVGQPVYWDSSGNENIMCYFRRGTTGRLNTIMVVNDGTPGTLREVSTTIMEISEAGSKQPLARIAQDGLDTYSLSVHTSDFDLFRNKSTDGGVWGTETAQLTNVEIDFVNAIVFTHSSGNGGAKVLGYFVEDSTTLVDGFTGGGWYKEYEIAAGGTGAMSGSSSGTSTVSGTLLGSGTLKGTSDGLTTPSGILKGSGILSGSSDGLATVTGTGQLFGTLSGSSSGSSTVSGTLLGLGILQGMSDGLSTPSGILKGIGILSGLSDGVATVSGTLVGTGNLVGSSDGVATISGILIGTANLVGSSDGLATLLGTLIGIGNIQGTSDGLSIVTGTLKGDGVLQGTADGLSTVTGTLEEFGSTGVLQGSSDGIATVTGTLIGEASLQGISDGIATVTGTLKGDGTLSGSADGLATVTGNILAYYYISGSSDGLATIIGTLKGDGALSGSADGVATVQGTMEQPSGAMFGVSDGVATVSGTLSATGAMSGSSFGETICNATLNGIGTLSGQSSGIGSSNGILLGSGRLIGVSSSIINVTGTLLGSGILSGLISGISSVTGILRGNGYLSGFSDGFSLVTGTLHQETVGYISGSADGSSIVSGILLGNGLLKGSSQGYSDLYGSLFGQGTLIGSSFGISLSSGVLLGFGLLIGSSFGVATVIGHMIDDSIPKDPIDLTGKFRIFDLTGKERIFDLEGYLR